MLHKNKKIKELYQEYSAIDHDMNSYKSEELMNLKMEFELHNDLVIGMVYPIIKSNSQPYLKFYDKLPSSFLKIEKMINDFVPNNEAQKEQKNILDRKNKILRKMVNLIDNE